MARFAIPWRNDAMGALEAARSPLRGATGFNVTVSQQVRNKGAHRGGRIAKIVWGQDACGGG